MALPYTKAPHQGPFLGHETAHAALLIDFDNVTMGMRSDLSKELKTLLDSDVIKGKVSVQRAYADWRRYPQYIVPLSEASVDLIFAPAYGSNKKNATDIRMAIDGMELVFVRPEIGTFILLTGDSDFSSLVLKLKEYGKYVIGVGIQESSSDILVQNCDEYYSYTSLTGLTKTTQGGGGTNQDPWVLVGRALERMQSRDDVMRSDRLKQVMQELEPSFDESAIGFSKFSKFMAEASSRGLVELKKMDNGQYEVRAPKGGSRSGRSEGRGRRDRGERGRGRGRRDRSESPRPESPPPSSEDPLRSAYDLLVRSLEELRDDGKDRVRDSDVKRKMLAIDRSFDETELGFAKFSKFLGQAADDGIVETDRTQRGNYEVFLPGAGEPVRVAGGSQEADEARADDARDEGDRTRDERDAREPARDEGRDHRSAEAPRAESAVPDDQGDHGPTVVEVSAGDFGGTLGFGPRGGSTRRRGPQEEIPLFEGQVVTRSAPAREVAQPAENKAGTATVEPLDAGALGLPTEEGSIVRYLAHRYKGVGEKTAESLVERFGTRLFEVLRDDPNAVADVVPAGRAEQVLAAWSDDYERRMARLAKERGGR